VDLYISEGLHPRIITEEFKVTQENAVFGTSFGTSQSKQKNAQGNTHKCGQNISTY